MPKMTQRDMRIYATGEGQHSSATGLKLANKSEEVWKGAVEISKQSKLKTVMPRHVQQSIDLLNAAEDAEECN